MSYIPAKAVMVASNISAEIPHNQPILSIFFIDRPGAVATSTIFTCAYIASSLSCRRRRSTQRHDRQRLVNILSKVGNSSQSLVSCDHPGRVAPTRNYLLECEALVSLIEDRQTRWTSNECQEMAIACAHTVYACQNQLKKKEKQIKKSIMYVAPEQ